ncbi:hypothetical protein [Azospirillum doebereinerae]
MTADVDWAEIVEFLSVHEPTPGSLDTPEDKDRAMFTLARYRDPHEDYEPVVRKVFERDSVGQIVLDPHGNPIVARTEIPIDPETGRPYMRRCAANIVEYTALALDYDGIHDLDWAKTKFKAYAVAGYTSYSHLKDGQIHKFRVVIPFHEPIPKNEFEARKTAILAFADTDDSSTISVSRGFYLPRAHPHRMHHARTWSHDGDPLDWTALEKQKPWVPPPPTVNPIQGDALAGWGRKHLDRQLDRIRQSGEGSGTSRHDAVLIACRAIGSVVAGGGLDRFEAASAIRAEATMKMGSGRVCEIESMIESGFRLGSTSPMSPPEARQKQSPLGSHLGATQSLSSHAKFWR